MSESTATAHVLSESGVPEDLVSKIMSAKKDMEHVDKIKQTLSKLKLCHAYPVQEKYKNLGWPLQKFWEIIQHVNTLYQNIEYLHEPWFEFYHDFLFNQLLPSVRMNQTWYVNNELKKQNGATPYMFRQIDIIQNGALTPLENMKFKVQVKKFPQKSAKRFSKRFS